ncbi:MAG: DEAD/DEAH box helicase [bacterium]|nr:DEAD/DEAH box helicase [bacterium]
MYTKNFNQRGSRHSSYKGGFSRGAGPSRFSPARGRGGFRKGPPGQYIDPSKFINKAVITEVAEHFVPEHNFQDFVMDERLKRNVALKGYTTPTPIQDRAIPHILKGTDVVGIANTGTGKTAAFLLPLINKVLANPKEKVLIVVPTRELAIQIDQEFRAFAKGMRMFSVCVVGGASIGKQISDLRYEHSCIIGTPGRLKDLISRKVINLAFFKTIVLDEADRMLDMGFVGDMRYVVSLMPKERHTLLFSATLSREIEKLVSEFLREPVRISVKTTETPKSVEQDVVRVSRGTEKVEVLHGLLRQDDFSKVLIFARTKHGAEKLSVELLRRGFKADSIHGDKNHSRRQRALGGFRDDHVKILVATDVAARGLDIADVSHVINYDIPATYDDYVHRIGRTGRGDKRGKALTFIE